MDNVPLIPLYSIIIKKIEMVVPAIVLDIEECLARESRRNMTWIPAERFRGNINSGWGILARTG